MIKIVLWYESGREATTVHHGDTLNFEEGMSLGAFFTTRNLSPQAVKNAVPHAIIVPCNDNTTWAELTAISFADCYAIEELAALLGEEVNAYSGEKASPQELVLWMVAGQSFA